MNSDFMFHYNFGKILRYMNAIDTYLQEGDTQNAIKGMIMIQMIPMSGNLLELTGVEEFLRRIATEFEGRQSLFATRVLEGLRSAQYGQDFHVCISERRFSEDDDDDDSNVYEAASTPPRQNYILQNILEDTLLNIAKCKDEIIIGMEALDLGKMHEGLRKLEKIPMCVDLLNRSGIKDFIAEIIIRTVGDLATISYRIWKHCRAVTLNSEEIIEDSLINIDRSYKLIHFYITRINVNVVNRDEINLIADILKLMKIPLSLDLIIKAQIKVCLYEAITINFSEVSNVAYKVLKKIDAVERDFLFGDKSETLNNEDNPENQCDNTNTNNDKKISVDSDLRCHLNLMSVDDDEILLGLIVLDNPNVSEEAKSQNQYYLGVLTEKVDSQEFSINSGAGTSFNCSNTLHLRRNPLKREHIDGLQRAVSNLNIGEYDVDHAEEEK